jgi:hypothetical protein
MLDNFWCCNFISIPTKVRINYSIELFKTVKIYFLVPVEIEGW